MLIRFKVNKDNGVSIIDNGKAYIFNISGVFISEEILNPRRLDGIQNLPIISIISSNMNTDIMVHTINDTEKYYKSRKDAMTCATLLTNSGDFVRMLRRTGKQDGIPYNQIIFVYRENVNVENKISLLDIEERN